MVGLRVVIVFGIDILFTPALTLDVVSAKQPMRASCFAAKHSRGSGCFTSRDVTVD
jgi:hypothetical protein